MQEKLTLEGASPVIIKSMEATVMASSISLAISNFADRSGRVRVPASVIKPSRISRRARSLFNSVQLLRARRGVNRCAFSVPEMLFAMPSIQPKQMASSTESRYVMLGCPEFSSETIQISVSVAWFATSQDRHSARLETLMVEVISMMPYR